MHRLNSIHFLRNSINWNDKEKEIYDFINEDSDPLNTLRTILLFGRNVSTYKFAFFIWSNYQKQKKPPFFVEAFSASSWARTKDPLINSQML